MTLKAARAVCSFAPVVALALGLATPLSSPPGNDKPRAGNLAQCIRMLTDEAEKSKADGALVRNTADFAKSFGDPPAQPALLEKILRPIASDDFTDAYVRWQLTSFDPPAFTMTELAFERLVETLPAFIEHPRAQASLIDVMQKAAAVGALNDKQQSEVNDRLNALAGADQPRPLAQCSCKRVSHVAGEAIRIRAASATSTDDRACRGAGRGRLAC